MAHLWERGGATDNIIPASLELPWEAQQEELVKEERQRVSSDDSSGGNLGGMKLVPYGASTFHPLSLVTGSPWRRMILGTG